jgi:iron complex outermembrane receptor protein
MKLKSALAGFLLCLTYYGFAQVETKHLKEVVIEALPFEKFSSGSKIMKSDSLQLAVLGQETLSTFLQQNTTVYIKEQGNKMLSTISFRGTGSSHTGVFWHGINLNSLTLGNTDLNGIPLFLFDDISVQFGGASSLHGSDAIGGSIHLSSEPGWTNGTKIQLRQDAGSFGNFFTGGKLAIGNGKWESKTRVFNRSLKNDFKYHITDRLGKDAEVTQENAQVHNYGIIQEVNYKSSRSSFLSFKGWFGHNEHQVQPMMVTYPGQEQDGAEIFDRNLRLITEYGKFFNEGILNASLSYAWDYQLFDHTDVIETKRMMANLSYEWDLTEKTLIKVGGFGQHISPEVWSYEEDLEEWRGDAFASLNHKFSKGWDVGLNLRKTFVQFTTAPVAPSLSTSYNFHKGKAEMTFRGQVERSYRIPTFNDRYWGEQGRKELRSEYGYSADLGYNLVWQQDQSKLEIDVSTYYMIVDDWIAWRPTGGLWRPFNLKKVESSGIEINGKYRHSLTSGFIEIGGFYAYNRAVLLEGISADDPAVGFQLPYTPQHRAIFFINIIHGNYRFSINNNYTGERKGIDVLSEHVDAFYLTDIALSKNFRIGRQLVSLEGQVLNLFDKEYQNVNRYAMPGRNYLMSINFFMNN